MSAETKYQVMGELLGILPSAIEKAEEQAGRIISIVKGGCSCSLVCGQETMAKLNELFPAAPEEDLTASVKVQPPHPEFRPKRTTKPTKESLDLTNKIVALRTKGLHWHDIAAKVGLSKEATRQRYRSRNKQQQEIPELYEPGAEDARREADAAAAAKAKLARGEATDLSGNPIPDEFLPVDPITEMIYSMDSSNALDIEILQAVKRNFPGVSMTVADVRARRANSGWNIGKNIEVVE